MTNNRNSIDWDLLKRRIRTGKLTPVIGDRVGHDGFLTSDELVQGWAGKIGYPMPNTRSITRVSQYRSVTKDPLAAKEDYLEYLKQYLLQKAQQPNGRNDFLTTLEDELDLLSFSQVAARLKYPNFEEDHLNPLKILAQFDIPIYLTTCFHTFMAQALKQSNKTPRLETCAWNDESGAHTSLFDEDLYADDPQKPVIYHLHGLDSEPATLVLSEDDFLDFLVNVTRNEQIVPYRIHQAMADSSLLLLGYELQDWDFRVLFRGLIKSKPSARRLMSICIQLDPRQNNANDAPEVEKYLETYFREYKFEIYWGSAQSFALDLWNQLGV